MTFMTDGMESLLRYEKDEQDFENIRIMVGYELNSYHIGKCFYDRLKEDKE